MLSVMMSVWSFWNTLRCLGLLNSPTDSPDSSERDPFNLSGRPLEEEDLSLMEGDKVSGITGSLMETPPTGVMVGCTKSADSSPGKAIPRYKYKGKSVKSNSVGIVEISSVRHTVVGGSILCVGGSHAAITGSRGDLVGDVTTHVKKICTFQQGVITNSTSTTTPSSSRPRRRSSSRYCRICRKYKDGPRRHR